MLHFVVPLHLLHEQQRIRLDVHRVLFVVFCPSERGEKAVVFGDVVGGDAERAVELLERVPVGVLDDDAVAGGPGVAAGAAVDVGGDQEGWGAGAGTKYRIRWQLSHWTMASLRRISLNICGRRRTWQIVQMPSFASATAMPWRLDDACS